MKSTSKKSKAKNKTKKAHPWNLCPTGEHWVRTHPMRTPATEDNPTGGCTTRKAHCARNPSGKTVFKPFEIKKIANRHFSNLKKPPCPISMKYKNGNKFDDYIAGWVQYWNDIFQPDVPLTSNIVKALIASESGFDPESLANPRNPKSARGLMQILDKTRVIMGNTKGELNDHFIDVSRAELNDPNINIFAGIRWLFHKKRLASGKLGRPATWNEAVTEYKSLSKDLKVNEPEAKNVMDKFNDLLKRLELCKEF